MIKVKVINPFKGRNEPTFRPFFLYENYFNDIGIEFTSSDTYDFVFLGMNDFLFKKEPLLESISKGVAAVEQYGKDVFLFDGSDSTSLLVSYEVLVNSNARCLFKNQLLTSREDYRTSTPFNKVFFLEESNLDIGYDITEKNWNRIKLSGFNLGFLLPKYRSFFPFQLDKTLDICAVYQGEHPENYEHTVRNDVFYTKHRKGIWNKIKSLKNYSTLTDKLPRQQFIETLVRSKLALAPFGMGEICFRDFELMQYGVLMVKPSMDHLNTFPNPYNSEDTYVSFKRDLSNLEEVLTLVLENLRDYEIRIYNFRKYFLENYTPETLVTYWYEFFKELRK